MATEQHFGQSENNENYFTSCSKDDNLALQTLTEGDSVLESDPLKVVPMKIESEDYESEMQVEQFDDFVNERLPFVSVGIMENEDTICEELDIKEEIELGDTFMDESTQNLYDRNQFCQESVEDDLDNCDKGNLLVQDKDFKTETIITTEDDKTIPIDESGNKKECKMYINTSNKNGKKLFYCEHCSYESIVKGNLITHMRIHTGERPFACKYCSSTFMQKVHLVCHEWKHTGEEPFKCDLCHYKCSQKNDLVKHKRTHTGEKPFSCDLCDYKCSQNSDLVKHKRTHTGEKPFNCDLHFSCDVCEYKCSRNSILITHKRTHTGEKPFSCDLCEYKCSRKSILNTHKLTHTGDKPFKCDLCDYKCLLKGRLLRHKWTHTEEKPFNCELCDYKCTQKHHLVRHKRKHIS